MVALVNLITTVIMLLILARVLMSWVRVDPYSPVARTIYELTEPMLAPVRNLLPPSGGFDFSPLILLIVVRMIGSIIVAAFQ